MKRRSSASELRGAAVVAAGARRRGGAYGAGARSDPGSATKVGAGLLSKAKGRPAGEESAKSCTTESHHAMISSEVKFQTCFFLPYVYFEPNCQIPTKHASPTGPFQLAFSCTSSPSSSASITSTSLHRAEFLVEVPFSSWHGKPWPFVFSSTLYVGPLTQVVLSKRPGLGEKRLGEHCTQGKRQGVQEVAARTENQHVHVDLLLVRQNCLITQKNKKNVGHTWRSTSATPVIPRGESLSKESGTKVLPCGPRTTTRLTRSTYSSLPRPRQVAPPRQRHLAASRVPVRSINPVATYTDVSSIVLLTASAGCWLLAATTTTSTNII